MLRARMFRSLIIRTGIKERKIRARNITIYIYGFKVGKELAPKAHVQVKFCSDPVRSEDYFPEWKLAFMFNTSSINAGRTNKIN